jgi:cyclase
MLPRVIPTLLLDGSRLVKTISFKKRTYIGDPINAVKLFNDMEVDELAFFDINASKTGSEIKFDYLSKIASECFMPLSYGGGINNIEDIRKLFKIGFEKVIINSSSIENPNLIIQASKQFGKQSIVGSIDVKKNFFGKKRVYLNGATKMIKIDPIDHAKELVKLGCGEIIICSVDHEGKMQGYDLNLIFDITSSINVPVIASGGAGNTRDFYEAIYKAKASAVAAGSMFVYQGVTKGILINYPSQLELKRIFKDD